LSISKISTNDQIKRQHAELPLSIPDVSIQALVKYIERQLVQLLWTDTQGTLPAGLRHDVRVELGSPCSSLSGCSGSLRC